MGVQSPSPLGWKQDDGAFFRRRHGAEAPLEGEEEDEDDVSDIISVSGDSTGGEVRQVNVNSSKPKRTRRKKKTEINL